jgi:hypothetical protein
MRRVGFPDAGKVHPASRGQKIDSCYRGDREREWPGARLALLAVADNVPPTRGVMTGLGAWIMQNWAYCAAALWLLVSAFMIRSWYRSEHAPLRPAR